MRVELPRLLEQLAAARAEERAAHEEHGEPLTGVCELPEPAQRLTGVGHALDAIVPVVALAELRRDAREDVAVVVDREKDGEGHRPASLNRRRGGRWEGAAAARQEGLHDNPGAR